MICRFLSTRWQTLAALVLTASAVAVSGCSNTDTSATVQPLAKHASGSLPLNFTYYTKVDGGPKTAVTGISNSQEIVGTYSLSVTGTHTITQSFTSTPVSAGNYENFVGDNYPQPIYTGDNDTSTDLVAINPGATSKTAVEAGWAINPGNENFTLGLIDNQGLWSALHLAEGERATGPCKVLRLSGINDSYDAVGDYETGLTSPCPSQAFEALRGEDFRDIQLGSAYSSSVATGIDDAENAFVGYATFANNNGVTVGWYKTTATGTGGVTEITISGSASVQALGINGGGKTVVGTYYEGTASYGFLCNLPCSDSSEFQLGINPCKGCSNIVVYGVNDSDDICGSYVGVDGNQHGFVAIPTTGPRRRAVQSHSPPR